ncbi:hypothetical protein [Eubacterium ventriosum]|uniref:TIR domain-containing protein n=1 Tax=Eubacterium ventriosum ATCC 27560 TaxID=411463 RepID=A5Z801_9FIRM|nr:hypothetical protein [Eubacterium ventriosum]EDM51058.1 hypothetical protein EUBVEN_01841 [Eubacterium ventriosum ATCC 27560]UWP36692.1 hypothetical protein NQ558_03840 [Eubacterium ventriosum]
MFAGFNLEINEHFFCSQKKTFSEYQKIGKEHLASQGKGVEKALSEYIKNNIVDGSEIQKDWFPEIEADIFLSHSSKDTELVNAIAGWLYDSFGLKCFVDSNVWCYAGNIADMLNSDYSNKRSDVDGGYLYDHKKCLKVSEHVNTMLNVALQKMIDKSESVFLINTDKSIHINRDSNSIDLTYSPWIYMELVCSEIVRKKPLSFYRYDKKVCHAISEKYQFDEINNDLTISYNAPTQYLIKINQDVLKKWKNQFNGKHPFPLDILYNDYFESEVEKNKKYFKY